jgi:endonuclease III
MLHRFKNTVPDWVVSAGCRVEGEFSGHTERIWAPGSHVVDVTERLIGFPGIGAKKSVMAVEILQRHLGVELEGRECGQVAYDVQVRRVFLRSGLVEEDTREAIEEAAALACPEAPATLDLAAWLIGRQTCRPRAPRCSECRLGTACPQLTSIQVEGVGHRG